MSIFKERERLADVSDQAVDMTSIYLESAIKRHQELADHARKSQVFTGQCLYCGENVRHPHAFCDEDCAADYRREQEIRRRQGLDRG